MKHSHSFTHIKGKITDIKNRVFGGPYSSLSVNKETYYFPPNCGVEELAKKPNSELFPFKIFLQLSLNTPPELFNFCAPPLALDKNGHLPMKKRGCHGCGPCGYIKRSTLEIFYIKFENSYLIPLPYYNEIDHKLDNGIMYRFEDPAILREWNTRISKYLQMYADDFNGLQTAIEVSPIRDSFLPFDYSPIVLPVFTQPYICPGGFEA